MCICGGWAVSSVLFFVCICVCGGCAESGFVFAYVLMRKILCSFHKLLRACSVCNACVSGWVLQSFFLFT